FCVKKFCDCVGFNRTQIERIERIVTIFFWRIGMKDGTRIERIGRISADKDLIERRLNGLNGLTRIKKGRNFSSRFPYAQKS
ncbi:MAG: hypothetical protein PHR27_10820, partial [Candidatus Cloacimonetes bacterium]|nr:hypothetical protein [Candidatus Cloacimonadota bacterium]